MISRTTLEKEDKGIVLFNFKGLGICGKVKRFEGAFVIAQVGKVTHTVHIDDIIKVEGN